MRAEGKSEAEIQEAVNKDAAMNAVFLAGTKAVESAGLLGAGKMGVGLTKRILGGAAGGGIINAGEEGGQSMIDDIAQGEEINYENASDSAKVGLLFGSVMGGAGGGITANNYITGNDSQGTTNQPSNLNDVQSQAWGEAQWVSQQTGVPAEFVYRQWAHESGNFTSQLARENNNFGGLTQNEANGEENKQPDGGNYYKQYGNMHEYAQDYINSFLRHYDGVGNVKSIEEFAQVLKDNGYYGDSVENYINGLKGIEAPTGNGIRSNYTENENDEVSSALVNTDFGAEQIAQQERELLDQLVNEKIEFAVQDKNIDEYDFLVNNKYDKDAILGKYPDIAEKIAEEEDTVKNTLTDYDFTSEQKKAIVNMAIDKSNISTDAIAINNLEKLIDKKDYSGIARLFPNEVKNIITPQFTETRNMTQANAVDPSQELITKAIAYYDRSENQVEKSLLEKLVDGSNVEGLKEFFSALSEDGVNIPQFQPPNQVIDPYKRDELSKLANALNGVVAQKFDDAEVGLDSVPRRAVPFQATDPQTQQRLDSLTGMGVAPREIVSPANQPNPAAMQAIQGMKPVPIKSGAMKTADEKVLENAFRSAVNRGDYEKAIEIAKQMNRGGIADKDGSLNSKEPGTEGFQEGNPKGVQVEENKDLTNTNGAQLAEGYKTQSGKTLQEADEREFIVKPDGSIDFGEITLEIEKATNGKVRAGKIRLQVGHNGFGLIHIKKREEDLKKIGYGSAEDYIDDIASNFNEIYSEKDANRFLLIKRDKRSAVMPVDLELTFDGEKYYAVISAIPMREKNLLKKLKEESPIYSKHLQGLASVSNDGAVSGDNNSDVGVTVPKATTAKSNDSSITNSIPQSKNNTQENPFSKDRARSKLDQLIGRKKKSQNKSVGIAETESKKKFVNVFDEASLDAEIEAIKKELSKMSANPVFNPTLMKHGFKIGGIFLQKGVNKTADWTAQMIQSLGDSISPYLKAIWSALQAYPEGQKFNDDIMTAVFEYVGAEHASGKSLNEIEAGFADEYGEEYLHYIDSAYEGVRNYPKKEEIKNEHHDSTGPVAERAGEGDNKNQVGANDGGKESVGRGGQAILPPRTEVRPRRSVRVRDDSATGSGEAGNRGDYEKAIEIANQMGNSQMAKILSAVNDRNKSYEQILLDTAKESGIKTNYKKLQDHINHGVKKATTHLENELSKKGIDVEQIKFSFNNRHDRDRQRMKEQEQSTKNYMPDNYRGEASGVMEGLTENDIQCIEQHIEIEINAGKSIERIEKELQLDYNRIKANKSNGMSDTIKVNHMRFIKGALGYVSEKRRRGNNEELLSPSPADIQRSDKRSDGETIRGTSGQRNNGSRLSGSHESENGINQNEHPNEGAFSSPENKPKYSMRGEKKSDEDIVHMVKNSTGARIKMIPEGIKLPPRLQQIANFSEKMGCPVRFYDGSTNVRGFHAGGVTYINRSASIPHMWVFWHESFHWLRNNNSKLYRDMMSFFNGKNAFTQKQIDAYKQEIGRTDLSNEEAIEEMLADYMPDVARRVGLIKQIGKDDPSLAERFIAWVRDTMDRFHELFTTPAEGLSPTQKKSIIKAFNALARDTVDADGNRIFVIDTSSNGKLNLRRNGEPVGSVLRGDTAVAYSAEGNFTDDIDKGVSLDDNLTKEEEQYLTEFEKNVLEKIEQDGEQLLRRFDPADGLEGLREKFISRHIVRERNKWLDFYEKYPNSNFGILKLGQTARKLGLERKELTNNDRILLELERSIIQKDTRGTYSGILGRIQGLRGNSSDMERSSGDNRQLREGNGKTQQISRLDLKAPAEAEPQGKHLAAYKEALTKYEKLIKEKKAAQEQYDSNLKEHPKEGAFSIPESKPKYSMDNGNHTFVNALDKIMKGLGWKLESGIETKLEDNSEKVSTLRYIFNSFNKIVERYPKLKPFFRAGNIAREKQENLRNHFQHKLDKLEKVLGSKGLGKSDSQDYKQNKQDFMELLWLGDAESKEFTNSELRESGYSGKVITAYRMMRVAINESYNLVNDVKQQIKTYTKTISKAEYKALKNNAFVQMISERENMSGDYTVTWKQPKIYEQKQILSKSELEALKSDNNVQIISAKLEKGSVHIMPESKGLLRGDDFYEVEYRTQTSPLGKIDGYIPHFFHNFFIMQKVVDEKGNTEYNMLKSAKSLREATQLGNEFIKKNPDAEILISQKQFKFSDEAMQASVIGDREYFKMMKKLSEDLSINLQDAQNLMQGKVSMKNRRRSFGNAIHRKGIEGFERDMDWVMRHYFNQVSRYVAMDEFKRTSINRFEQLFGKWESDNLSPQARIAKDYINDINGVPSVAEEFANNFVKSLPIVNRIAGKVFYDRPALQAAGWLTKIGAVTKLNVLNVASTMIQFTQLMNIAGALNSYEYTMKGMKEALNPTLGQRKFLHEAGLEAELSMSVSGGYSKAEIANKFLGMTTWTFNKADRILRATALLGAYHKGMDSGMTRADAMEYAKEINRMANFDYAITDAPNLFRRTGPLGQIMLQFQKYPIKQIEFMWDMFAQGQKVDTTSIYSVGRDLIKIIKTNDKGKAAKFFVPYFMLSGMMGIPFVGIMGGLIGMVFGWEDWEEKVKKNILEWAGKDEEKMAIAKFCIYGATAVPENGFDSGYRVGIGDFATARLPRTEAEALSKLLGVTGSSIYQAIRQESQGNSAEALKAISPGIGNIAIAMAGEVKTTRGRVKYSFEEDMYGKVLKGLGFMPIDERLEGDVNRIIKVEEAERKNKETQAIDDYITEPTKENLEIVRKMKISAKRVQEERRKKKLSAAERLSKSEKKRYSELNN